MYDLRLIQTVAVDRYILVYQMVNILHRRAVEDATGELKYALTAWVTSPAAQAVTDGHLGGLSEAAIDELKTLANSEMAKAIRKARKEQKNEENS